MPGDELFGGSVLEQEAAGAGAQSLVQVLVHVEGREHHDLRVRAFAVEQHSSRFDAVERRHADVHQHDVRPQPERLRDGVLAVLSLADHLDVLLGVQNHAEAGPDERLVVDDQHADDAAVPRRRRFRRVGGHQLIDTYRAIEVLQLLLSEVDQREGRAVVFLVVEERGCRLREQDLAALARRADPGGPMDRESVVLTVRDRSLTRVDADAHAERHAVGPGVRGQRALRSERGEHGVLRAAERDEERVPLRADPFPTGLLEGCP